MSPAQPSAADPGIRHLADFAAHHSGDANSREVAIAVLLVGRRSTAQALEASLPHGHAHLQPLPDVLFDAHLGPDQGIHLSAVTSQRAALLRIKVEPPRAVLVEIGSRPQSRVRFCRLLRSRAPAMAILAVSEHRPQSSFAFDDFLKPPLSADRTAAAVSRLCDQGSGHILRCGPIELNLATRTVHTPGGAHRLTPKMSALLELLIARHDEIVTRREIMESIWETSYLDDTRTLDVHVRWLRDAVEPDPSNPVHILTERGKGYGLRCG